MAKYIIELNDDEVLKMNNGKHAICIICIMSGESINETIIHDLIPVINNKDDKCHNKRWRAKRANNYLYNTDYGHINMQLELNEDIDDWRYESGNYFRTYDEVVFYRHSLIIYTKLKDYAVPDDEQVWDNKNWYYYIYYDYASSCIEYGHTCLYKESTLYFATKKDAKRAVTAVGEKNVKKYYLKVRE